MQKNSHMDLIIHVWYFHDNFNTFTVCRYTYMQGLLEYVILKPAFTFLIGEAMQG